MLFRGIYTLSIVGPFAALLLAQSGNAGAAFVGAIAGTVCAYVVGWTHAARETRTTTEQAKG